MKLTDIERNAKAQKQRGGRGTASLGQPINEEDTDPNTLADLLPGSEDTANAATNRLPIDQALARLTLRQRQLISGLNAGFPVSQITQALDVPRTTLYDELTRIRQVFRDEGLSTYLDGPDT